MARKPDPRYEPECANPRCGMGPADPMHGSIEDCIDEPGVGCPNPEDHHEFEAPLDGPATIPA
jgi:hypothetical protein